MWTWNYLVLGLLVLLGTVSFSPSTQAADLNGAWASDASVCSKVFVKDGNKISFTPDAELYGAGLIVEGNRATGAFQKCTIKSMKDDGVNVHVIAACSTGVMVSDAAVHREDHWRQSNHAQFNQYGSSPRPLRVVRQARSS